MGENTEMTNASKELISSKINLLKTDIQPIFTKIRTGHVKDNWEKYRWKLYFRLPFSKSMETLLNNKVLSFILIIVGAFLALKFATPIEGYSTYLLEKINKMDNQLVNNLLTENGEVELDEKIKNWVTFGISIVPVSILIYAVLHLWHIGTSRKEMIDYNNGSFNLGLYKIYNPEIFQLATSFGNDGFDLNQLESYIRSDDDSEKQKQTIDMITEMRNDLIKFESDVNTLTNDTNVLNELLDTFQSNFNRLSNFVLSRDIDNFEFSLSLLSKKFVLYHFTKDRLVAQKIIDSGHVGSDRMIEIEKNKHEPFIYLYLKGVNASKINNTVSYMVNLNDDETYVITYYLDEHKDYVRFLIGDVTIGVVEEEESIFLSQELYQIVRKHLELIHHINLIINGVGEV